MITYDTTEEVDQKWTSVEISGRVADVPVLLAAIQEYSGADTADVRIDNLHQRDFPVNIPVPGYGEIRVPNALSDLRMKLEGVGDIELSTDGEVVGHIAFDPGQIKDFEGNLIGYANHIKTEQPDGETWTQLPIDSDSFSVEDSVVFMQVLSFNGSQPVHPRIAQSHPETDRSGFHFKMEEWPMHDQYHVREQLGYVVLKTTEEGERHAPGLSEDPHLDVGSFEYDPADSLWQTVELDNVSGSGPPVVVTQYQEYDPDNPEPVVTRQKRPENDEFKISLQQAENRGDRPSGEIGYLAIGVPFF